MVGPRVVVCVYSDDPVRVQREVHPVLFVLSGDVLHPPLPSEPRRLLYRTWSVLYSRGPDWEGWSRLGTVLGLGSPGPTPDRVRYGRGRKVRGPGATLEDRVPSTGGVCPTVGCGEGPGPGRAGIRSGICRSGIRPAAYALEVVGPLFHSPNPAETSQPESQGVGGSKVPTHRGRGGLGGGRWGIVGLRTSEESQITSTSTLLVCPGVWGSGSTGSHPEVHGTCTLFGSDRGPHVHSESSGPGTFVGSVQGSRTGRVRVWSHPPPGTGTRAPAYTSRPSLSSSHPAVRLLGRGPPPPRGLVPLFVLGTTPPVTPRPYPSLDPSPSLKWGSSPGRTGRGGPGPSPVSRARGTTTAGRRRLPYP